MRHQEAERQDILHRLIPEFTDEFTKWNEEYQHQPRDLGARGEFASIWRKVKKIKAIVWDDYTTDGWREGLRTVILEAICHLFLLLHDLDLQHWAPPLDGNDPFGHRPEREVDLRQRIMVTETDHAKVPVSLTRPERNGVWVMVGNNQCDRMHGIMRGHANWRIGRKDGYHEHWVEKA